MTKVDLTSWIVKILESKEHDTAIGTGFWVKKDHVLTCHHVVENLNPIWILYNKNKAKAKIIRSTCDNNKPGDIALLIVERIIGIPAPLGLDWKKGDEVDSQGYQYDGQSGIEDFPMTGTIIGSATKDQMKTIAIKDAGHVQSGSSGAPAWNQRTRKVIGIISHKWQSKNTALLLPLDTISHWEILASCFEKPSIVDSDSSYSYIGGSEGEFEDQTKLPPVCKLEGYCRFHSVPYRSIEDAFVGRIEDLWKIRRLLQEKQQAVIKGIGVIMGMGGLGKTQLAIECVHRFGYLFPGGVFWVDAEQGRIAMINKITKDAGIDIDNTQSEKNQLELLWKRLRHMKPILIVLDNFPAEGPLKPWLPPPSSIHVLVTTRRKDLYEYSCITLDKLSEKEGTDLLNSGPRKFGPEAAKLARTLGGLPLALELSKHYLNYKKKVNIRDLLQFIQKEGEFKTIELFEKKYGDELPSGHTKEVAHTFQISYDLADETEQRVLQAISLLAPTPIPQYLLKDILGFSDGNVVDDPLDDAISNLANKISLIDVDEDNDPFMHRLIAAFIRVNIDDSDKMCQKVGNSIEKEMSRAKNEDDAKAYFELEKIVPHAEIVFSYSNINVKQRIEISNYLGWHYEKWGMYLLAKQHGQKSLALAQNHFGPGHPKIVEIQSNLSWRLMKLGLLQEAKELSTTAFESAQKCLKTTDHTFIIIQSQHSVILREAGEVTEASELARQALDSALAIFEPEHPEVAMLESQLAMSLKEAGKLDEAKALLLKSYASAQKSFEKGHPKLGIRQSRLSLVLHDLNELDKARKLGEAALDIAKNNVGPEHHLIANRQSRLSLILMDLGELDHAKVLAETALDITTKNFTEDHPMVAIHQQQLGMVLLKLGEHDRAQALLHESYDIFLHKFGPDHKNTQNVKVYLEMKNGG